jgi:TonB family protein
MARRIEFHFLHSLFRLFAYLADRSGGWRVFVKPKLILGGLIIGIGVTACQSGEKAPTEKANSVKDADKEDIKLQGSTSKALQAKVEVVRFEVPSHTCYDTTIIVSTPAPHLMNNDTTIYSIVGKMPLFIDGDVNEYIAKNIRYPAGGECYAFQARVICQFVVEPDGSITNAKVVRGVDPYADSDALRVISSMPKWIPGEQDGKKVRVRYTLPVNFRLQ